MNDELKWLREQLGRFTYRPGWSLEIEEADGYAMMREHRLRVRYCAPDSRDPDREIPVEGVFPVWPHLAESRDEKLFAEWLRHTLFEVERHESQEWLRRDGEIYDDPHVKTER